MKQEYSRIGFAVEQLDMALKLFMTKESFVSALTLAGASEEILGKQLKIESKDNALEKEYSIIKPVRQVLTKKEFRWTDFTREKNEARNSAKHMDDESQKSIVVDIEDEALWMIVRAHDNYMRLGFKPTRAMLNFDCWFNENVVGR